jgi:multidrug efflux pump subunit AcrA (membrane-fusion protein)
VKRDSHPRSLSEALEDHSVEGIAILTAEPVRLARALIWAMVALVVAGLLWSFVGRADVIVSAQGTLSPESEVRRIYAPIDGELADLYIAEGQPVSKGDVLARLNARGAIEAASNALQAQLKLEDAERDWKQFPEKKALMERKAWKPTNTKIVYPKARPSSPKAKRPNSTKRAAHSTTRAARVRRRVRNWTATRSFSHSRAAAVSPSCRLSRNEPPR